MRVEIRRTAAALLVAGLLTAGVTVPVPAAAQCGMMGGAAGGGHDQGAMQGARAVKQYGSDRKMRQSIDRLLSDERGRALLAEALLADRAMMESLVARLASNPEWRAMASRQLASPDPSGPARGDARLVPNSTAVAYACPMHPDVTSSSPGECPRCGMALVRKESRPE